MQSHLSSSVQGDAVPFEDEEITRVTDVARVRKIYKLNAAGGGGKKKTVNGVNGVSALSAEIEKRELQVQVLGAMALRSVTN